MSQHSAKQEPATSNVVNLFTGEPFNEAAVERIVRISPELDGMEMLYTNDASPERLYSLKIVCWGIRESGEVVGLVPWLNDIVPCIDIDDPLNGRWQGYRNPISNEIFYEAPIHKVVELESCVKYYQQENTCDDDIVQEIPDVIGTHAVLTQDGFQSFVLVEVSSWRLCGNGRLSAMLIDEQQMQSTPVLPGDPCLYTAQDDPDFRYFFQHRIANKIKAQDPEALAAVSLLIER